MVDLLAICLLLALPLGLVAHWAPPRPLLLIFALLFTAYLSLVAGAWWQNRDGAKVCHTAVGSPADSTPLSLQPRVTRVNGVLVSGFRDLYALALVKGNQDVTLTLENEGRETEYTMRLGLQRHSAMRQTETDLAQVFSGARFFCQRAIMRRLPHPLLWWQQPSIRRGAPITSVNGTRVRTVGELRQALGPISLQQLFSIEVVVAGRTLNLLANLARKNFPTNFPESVSKMKYLGATDWGLSLVDFPEGLVKRNSLLEQLPYLILYRERPPYPSLGLLNPVAGDRLHFFHPLAPITFETLTLSEELAKKLREHGLTLVPELGFPIQYMTHTNPFVVGIAELKLRAQRMISPSAYQVAEIISHWKSIPKRWYEIPELRWQGLSFWLGHWASICLIAAVYLGVQAALLRRGLRIKALPFLIVIALFFLHELFVFPVMR